MGVERVQHVAHLGEQSVVVSDSFSRPGHDGFEADGLRDRLSAHVKRVNHRAQACESSIRLEIEAHEQRLEGDAIADVREGRAIEVEAHRALRAVGGLVEPSERGLGVDEAANQPGTGHPVDPETTARRPRPAAVLAGVQFRHLAGGPVRFVRRQDCVDALAEIGPGGFGLDACFGWEEVDPLQSGQLLLQSLLEPRQLVHRLGSEPAALDSPARSQLGELLRAVKQLPIGDVVVGRVRNDRHQPGASVFALALVAEFAQRLDTPRTGRHQVGTVTQGGTTERFQRAPDPHAASRARCGQRDHKKQPMRR